MAATAVTTVVGFLIVDSRRDVEGDTNPAAYSTVNFHISGTSQLVTLQVPTSALSGINTASPASLTLSQGAGTLGGVTTTA